MVKDPFEIMQVVKKIKNCRVCGGSDMVPFFDLGKQPLANSLLIKANEKEKKYPLSLSWCRECSLVQLDHTVPPEKLFSKYVWVTGTSVGAKSFAEVFCEKLLSRIGLERGGLVLEIASNDGTFLKPFKEKGFQVLGIDPARNIVKMANADGIPSKVHFFGTSAAKKIVKSCGKARIVFARNVLPHVAKTRDFVAGLNHALSDDGILAIEVHYAKAILEGLHYDSVYHEHLCYFTLKSLEKLLSDHGLYVFDFDESPISGGSLIVYASKRNLGSSEALNRCRQLEEASRINDLKSWRRFAKVSASHRGKLLKLVAKETKLGKKISGYGASARSSTLLNFCGIDSKTLPVIYDKNTLKQKKFTAGTRISISKPEQISADMPDVILLLAWNFSDEIIAELSKRFGFKGKYIIPLPANPRIISS